MADDGELNVQYTSVIKNSNNQNESKNCESCNEAGYSNSTCKDTNNNNNNNNISTNHNDDTRNGDKDNEDSNHCGNIRNSFREATCSQHSNPVDESSNYRSASNNNDNTNNNNDDDGGNDNNNNNKYNNNDPSTTDTDLDEDDMVKNKLPKNNVVKCNRVQVPENYYKISMNELRSYENLLRIFVLASLKRVGVCVIENFLPEILVNSIVDEIQKLHKNPNIFTPSVNNEDYRGDVVYWLGSGQETEQCDHIKHLEKYLHQLVLSMVIHEKQRGNILKITHKSRTQISCFKQGEIGYKPHIDNPDNNGRLLSVTFYCNKDYSRLEDGGLVRFYLNNNTKFIELEPRFNTAVISWSDRRVIKEVLPSTSARNLYHLSSWFFGSSSESAKRQLMMN